MASTWISAQRPLPKLLGSGSDWMLVGSDGFMRMDVRVQIETDDGAIIGPYLEMEEDYNSRWIDFGVPGSERVLGMTTPAHVFGQVFAQARAARAACNSAFTPPRGPA